MRKGQKMPEQARIKMSLARKGIGNPMYGKKAWNKGKKGIHLSPKSEFKKGIIPWNKGKHPEYVQNKNHPQWKGNKVGYGALHVWLKRHLGKPDRCNKCGKKYEIRLLHWANISGKYKRDKKDWIHLCYWCHKKFDKENGYGRVRKRFPEKFKPYKRKNNWKIVSCLKCGKKFKKPLCRLKIGKGKYCSRKCFLERNKT